MVSTSRTSGRARLLRRKMRRDIVRSKWQYVAVTLTVVLGVMLFAASYNAFLNLSASYERTYDDLAFADLTVSGGDQQAIEAAAREQEQVVAVERRVQADVPFLVDDHKLLGRVVSLPPDQQPAVNRVRILSGDYLDPEVPLGVLVERHMSDHFDLQPGDKLDVLLEDGYETVTVLGTVASAEYIVPARSRQEIFATPEDFGVLFVPDGVTERVPAAATVPQTMVLYEDGLADDEISTLDGTLAVDANQAGAADVMTQADQPSNAGLAEDLQGFGELSVMFPVLFLTGAGLATFIILNRLVHSQRGQIGTLSANGLSRRQILRHYLGYGVLTGLVGAAIGLLLGMPLGALTTSAYTGALTIPDTVVGFYPMTPVVGLMFGLIMGALAAWAPARAAVNVPPAQAMRGEIPEKPATRGVLERIVPGFSGLPVRWKASLRGISRRPLRSVSTVSGVVLAIVLILASWGMIDTVQILLAKQFDDVQHQDAQVSVAEPLDEAVVQQFTDIDGVGQAEGVLTLPTSIRADEDQYATSMQGFAEGTVMHSFLDGQGRELPLPEQGVLVGTALQDILGLAEGDAVTLGLSTLDVSLDAEVVGFVDEPLGTPAYARSDWLREEIRAAGIEEDQITGPEAATVFVTYEEGVSSSQMRDALSRVDGVLAVVSATAIRDLMDQFLALFYAFVGVMLVFGGILAFALIFNTISVNIAERSGELANMRANGVSSTQVNRMMTIENMVLTLIGIPVGLVVGYLIASAFMSSFSSDLFSFDLEIRGSTLVLTALAIVVVTLLSQLPGLRAVRNLDIARVVRERSL
jgi:putative ABC transport system permease protein